MKISVAATVHALDADSGLTRSKDLDRSKIVPFLRRLARRGACARRQSGNVRGAGGWHIVSASDNQRSGVTRSSLAEPVDASGGRAGGEQVEHKDDTGRGLWPVEIVQKALSDGLVELDGADVRLSAGGAAFLRRSAAEGDDPFASQHQVRRERTLLDDAGGTVQVTVNECESPLGWLRNRKDRKTGKAMISRKQFEAGERLRHDFLKAHMSARVTADWSCAMSGGRSRRTAGDDRVDITDAAIAAKTRFYGALDAVGEELSDVLVWVCCDGRGLRDVEQSAGWPQRSGKLMLQMALRALARHYGLEPSRTASTRGGDRVRHWASDGYRPSI